MLGEVRLQLDDGVADRFHSCSPHLLVLTLRKDEPHLPVVETIKHH
jgi:hypothetical protein